jgi:hypothetical protein
MSELILTVGNHPVAGLVVLSWALWTVYLTGDKAIGFARAWRGDGG